MTELVTQNHFAYRIHFQDGTSEDVSKNIGEQIKTAWDRGLREYKHSRIDFKSGSRTTKDIKDIEDLNNKRLLDQLQNEQFMKKFWMDDKKVSSEDYEWWLMIGNPALKLIYQYGIEKALEEDKTFVVKQYLEDSIKNLTKQKERGEKIIQNTETIKNYKKYLDLCN